MTKKQFSKAAKVITRGCTIVGYLYLDSKSAKDKDCGHAGHCAIGDLLFAAGVPNEKLLRTSNPDSKMQQLLEDEYGIQRDMTDTIMSMNDERSDLCERRKDIIGYLKSCVSETQSAE